MLWRWHERRIRAYHPEGVVAALQLYSDKTQVTHKGKNLHPMRASLLNIRFKTRIKNYRTVAYLPIVHKNAHMKEEVQRLVKLSLYSKCLKVLLEPMKDSSFNGTSICIHLYIIYVYKYIYLHLVTINISVLLKYV